MVDLLHKLDGKTALFLSLRSWSIHRLFGRPGRRFQLCSGGWPRVRSTWHRSAWCAGVSSESLAMWPKTEFRRRFIRYDTLSKIGARCNLRIPDDGPANESCIFGVGTSCRKPPCVVCIDEISEPTCTNTDAWCGHVVKNPIDCN